MDKLKFDDTKQQLKSTLTDNFIGFMNEACIVALNSQKHKNEQLLHSFQSNNNLYKKPYNLVWDDDVDDRMLNTHNDDKRTTDYGAMFLSLALTLKLTPYTEFEASKIGSGVDFWLSGDDDNFIGARLEISGIREIKGSNTIENRLKIKLEQTNKSDKTKLPAYISIIEFNNPQALFIEK